MFFKALFPYFFPAILLISPSTSLAFSLLISLLPLQAVAPTTPTIPQHITVARWGTPAPASASAPQAPGLAQQAGWPFLGAAATDADVAVAAAPWKRVVLFAGEHTAAPELMGTLAGALASGAREAARAVKLCGSSSAAPEVRA